MTQLPSNREPSTTSTLLKLVNPLEWFRIGFGFVSFLFLAFRHATWDQVREAAIHMPEDRIPAPAKAGLVIFHSASLLAVVVLWAITHALLPFLIFSIAEELFLGALLTGAISVSCWGFNRYARSIVGVPAFIRPRTVVVPADQVTGQIGEDLDVEGEGVRERVPEGVRREDE